MTTKKKLGIITNNESNIRALDKASLNMNSSQPKSGALIGPYSLEDHAANIHRLPGNN